MCCGVIQCCIACPQTKSRLREMISKIELWHWSLRYVEGNFGTGLVAFFTFIKWLLYLNLFTCALLAVFILVPQIFLVHSKVIHNTFFCSLMLISNLVCVRACVRVCFPNITNN